MRDTPTWLVERDESDGWRVEGRGRDDVDGDPFADRLNPDCRAGAHRACAGDAWSDELDGRVPCACGCHRVRDVAVREAFL